MLSIGEFSRMRYYDEIDLLKPAYVNNENGYRYYTTKQLEKILMINRLKDYSFLLVEIKSVMNNNSLLLKYMNSKLGLIKQEISEQSFLLNRLSSDIINLEKGVEIMSYLDNIKVELKQWEAQNIISVRDIINVNDYGKMMGKLFEKVCENKLTIAGQPMSVYYDDEFNPENADIEIAIPVKEKTDNTRIMKEALCAFVRFEGTYSDLGSVYSEIRKWVDTEDYSLIAAPFEVYITDPKITQPDKNIVEVYAPVKKQ